MHLYIDSVFSFFNLQNKSDTGLISCIGPYHLFYFAFYEFDIVIINKPTINSRNIAKSKGFVPLGASLNSFHTNTPQIMATTGEALLSAYEMAGLVAPVPIKLMSIPPIHINPPKTPIR